MVAGFLIEPDIGLSRPDRKRVVNLYRKITLGALSKIYKTKLSG